MRVESILNLWKPLCTKVFRAILVRVAQKNKKALELLQEFQRFVFCRFHQFALSRPFVVDAAKVEDAVNDDAV